MLTPYDWQEAIGNRASFIEGRLAVGAPVLALSIGEGIVMFTYRRYTNKIFEIYDNLAFSAIGQQSDIETLRMAAIDFAHQEGFNRSENDVTIRRVVSTLSTPIKRGFADFSSPPFIFRGLFAELGDKAATDTYAVLDYEGEFKTHRNWAFLVGSEEFVDSLRSEMTKLHAANLKATDAKNKLKALWDKTFPGEMPEGYGAECVLLRRESDGTGTFVQLTPQT